jgi:hypothetical protein
VTDGQYLLRVLATEATTQEIAITDISATSMTEKPRGRKIGQSRMPKQSIQFPRKLQQYLIANRNRRHPLGLLLISWEASTGRQGR